MQPLRKLYSYQKETLDKITNRPRIALFWQMRLGKSIVAIRWILRQNPTPTRILILCPKSVIVAWKEELAKEKIAPWIIDTSHRDIVAKLPEGWFVTNYECLIAKNMPLSLLNWDAIICDESTKIKNPQARISDIVSKGDSFPFRGNKHPFNHITAFSNENTNKQLRAILTGTPAPESYLNYFNQFKFLFGGIGPHTNYWTFRQKYFYVDELRHKYIPHPFFIPRFANYLEQYASTLSRKQVGINLPHHYVKRFVTLSKKWREIYDEFEENWYSDFLQKMVDDRTALGSPRSPAQLMTNWATVAQSYLHQMACGFPKRQPEFQAKHKLNELRNILEGELANEKVVIWCQYLNDITQIEAMVYNIGRHPKVIDGKTTTNHLEYRLKSFRRTETNSKLLPTDILICQIRKASMGMDLSAANTQVFFSRSWSALDNQQAIDRLIHPEKKSSLLTIDLITENTIDHDLHLALIDKKAEQNVYKYFLQRTKFKKLGDINNERRATLNETTA